MHRFIANINNNLVLCIIEKRGRDNNVAYVFDNILIAIITIIILQIQFVLQLWTKQKSIFSIQSNFFVIIKIISSFIRFKSSYLSKLHRKMFIYDMMFVLLVFKIHITWNWQLSFKIWTKSRTIILHTFTKSNWFVQNKKTFLEIPKVLVLFSIKWQITHLLKNIQLKYLFWLKRFIILRFVHGW